MWALIDTANVETLAVFSEQEAMESAYELLCKAADNVYKLFFYDGFSYYISDIAKVHISHWEDSLVETPEQHNETTRGDDNGSI